jgi:hypothetical protein
LGEGCWQDYKFMRGEFNYVAIKHGCFLSYKHGTQYLMKKINEEVHEALNSELEPYIPSEDRIFRDTNRISPGDYIDEKIALALCESACMVVVYVPSYLSNDHSYCAREFCAMIELERQRYENVSNIADTKKSLIITIAFCEVERVPPEIKGNRKIIEFKDFNSASRRILKKDRYIKEFAEIAKYIDERYKMLNNLTLLNPKCTEFKLPDDNSDNVKKLLRDTHGQFPR